MMSKIKFFNEQTLSALKKAGNVLLCTHVNPDGDAIGSMLATARLLRRMGKETLCVCHDPVPYTMMWLDGAEGILKPEQVMNRSFDTAIALDLPDTKRMGTAAELFAPIPVKVRIDHHPSAEAFSDYEAADGAAAATGELITAIKKYLPYGPMFFDADTVTDHIPVFIDAVGREAVLAQDKVDGVPKVLQGVQQGSVQVKDD